VGAIAIPELLRQGYDKPGSMGLIVCSGTLGQMIPPSIYMVLFATLVQGDVSTYFVAGVVPGLMVGVFLIIAAVVRARSLGMKVKPVASWDVRVSTFKKAFPVLLMPPVVLGGIYGGIFTPTEAAAVSIVYSLLISKFVFGTLTMENFLLSARDAIVATAVIFIILGGATMMSVMVTYLKMPQALMAGITELGLSPLNLLLAIIAMYFVLGMVMDPVPIMYITIPILLPVLIESDINLVHFSVVTVAAMMVAQATPPFGMALFAMTGMFKEPIAVVVRGTLPYLVVLMICTVIIVLFPEISLFLPNLMSAR